MAYSKQIWDATSYVNPTRMNHIEDGIASVEQEIVTQRYLKKSETSGNVLNVQLYTYSVHRIILPNSIYHVIVTSAFNYNSVYHIGGDKLSYSINSTSGVITFGNLDSAIVRNNTNSLIEMYSLG